MCIAIACIGTETPTVDELETGCWNNPDGFGWIVVYQGNDGRVIASERTLESKHAIESYFAMMDEVGERAIASAFHARIGTHGANTIDNCHPWQVGDDAQTMLIHNGILSIDVAKGDPRSDTGVFAGDLLPAMGGVHVLGNPVLMSHLENWTGYGNKVVILTANEDYAPLTIIGEKRGQWYGNVWYSNSSCFPYSSSAAADPRITTAESAFGDIEWRASDAESEDDVFYVCTICDADVDADRTMNCWQCGVCFECGEWECLHADIERSLADSQ